MVGMRAPAIELYPERRVENDDAIGRIVVSAQAWSVDGLGAWRRRRLRRILARVRGLDADVEKMSARSIVARARALHPALRASGCTDEAALARCFALVREAARRTLGMRHHDVQIMGALAIVRGTVAEMRTGEGKTLTATLAAVAGSLAGWPVHLVTVNDYLAERDADAMRELYAFFGLSVGVVRAGQSPAERRVAYACDIAYCTNKELAFDYLRDRIELDRGKGGLRARVQMLAMERGVRDRLVMRGLHFAIVDEADSVLVDEARTPLVISREVDASGDARIHVQALEVARALEAGKDFVLRSNERSVTLTPRGSGAVEKAARPLGAPWSSTVAREELVVKALTALHLNRRDEHYIVRDRKVQIVDEYTGRVMADRSWSYGIQQMTELKEGLEVSRERETLARMTYQRFFRRYRRLAGMTGTAAEVARELWRVYRLAVTRIPPHEPSKLVVRTARVFTTQERKWRAIIGAVRLLHARGAPVLLATRTVAASLEAAGRLREIPLSFKVLNATQDAHEAAIIALAGEVGHITIGTNMCGRGTDIPVAEQAKRVGGLHVIMSERHEARRIDRQLAGRAGRQGDPGVFEPVLSLNDPLVGEADRTGTLRWLARVLMPVLGQWVGRTVLDYAQWRTERLHARMRKDLLKQDEELDRMLAFSGKPE